MDSFNFQSDYNFANSHDYKVAKIIANDNIPVFLETKIQKLEKAMHTKQNAEKKQKGLKWMGSKVALVVLHAEGVLNNSKASFNEIDKNMGSLFDLDMRQFNRKYLEIRNRKTMDKANLINSLRDNLL